MAKYRVRPSLTIEAIKWTEVNFDQLMTFTNGGFMRWHGPEFTARVFDTLHDTWISLRTGDMVVRGMQGEFYPVKRDIFEHKYEEIKQ